MPAIKLTKAIALILICLSPIILSGCWPLFIGPGVKAVGVIAGQYADKTEDIYTLTIMADVPLVEKVIYKAMGNRDFTLVGREVEVEKKTQIEIIRFKVERNGTVYVFVRPEDVQSAKVVIRPKDADDFESAGDAQSLWFGVLDAACSSNLQVSCH